MIHDKIQLAIKDVKKLEEELKEAKKDIRKEEKIDDDKYLEMKSGLKAMRDQVKDFEEDFLQDMRASEFYNQLRENVQKSEEKLALAREKLFELLGKVPLKAFEINLKEEDGFTKIQALPEMRIYINGREVKRAA